MKRFFATNRHAIDVDLVLLITRIIVGYAFILHGWGKIQNPFGWAGEASTIPPLFLGLAALAEFGGGIALILGLLTRLAAIGLACTMVVAIYMHAIVMGDPFVNMSGGGSFEPATVYLLLSLLILVLGPGRYSLDRRVFGVRAH